jgi:hypothetical protein
MSMKGAKWSGTTESNVSDNTAGINTSGISRHVHGDLPHGRLQHACLPHARLLDGSDVQAEMLHTRIQSINFQQKQNGFQQAQNGPVSIERHFAGRDFANSSDSFERSNTQNFAAQSIWSYLHALPVEAKLK